MQLPSSAWFRARARDSLRGQWGRNAGFTALLYLLYTVVSSILESIPVFGDLVVFLCSGAVSLGINGYFLHLVRGRKPPFSAFFDGFPHFWKAFLLYVLITLFTLLWSLLLIVPGIVAFYRYSQAYFILKDDPQVGALEAINASKELMAGNKARLFFLHLSFIGWFLLCLPTMGIGYLWLYPYAMCANAHFYEELKSCGRPLPPPPPGSF